VSNLESGISRVNSFISPFDKLALIFIKLNGMLNMLSNIVTVGDAVDGILIKISTVREFIEKTNGTLALTNRRDDKDNLSNDITSFNSTLTMTSATMDIESKIEYDNTFLSKVEDILVEYESKINSIRKNISHTT
jgi:hypothetical protein